MYSETLLDNRASLTLIGFWSRERPAISPEGIKSTACASSWNSK